MPRYSDPQSDELAMAVGYALQAWTGVENMLSYLFETVSGMEHVASHIAIASVVGFDARLEMCSALVRRSLRYDLEHDEIWSLLRMKLSKGYKSRHQVAHFQFVISGDASGQQQIKLVPFWSFGQLHLGKAKTALGRAEIDDKTERFQKLGESVYWFKRLLETRLKPHAEPLGQEPELIRHLRSTAIQSRASKQPLGQSFIGNVERWPVALT